MSKMRKVGIDVGALLVPRQKVSALFGMRATAESCLRVATELRFLHRQDGFPQTLGRREQGKTAEADVRNPSLRTCRLTQRQLRSASANFDLLKGNKMELPQKILDLRDPQTLDIATRLWFESGFDRIDPASYTEDEFNAFVEQFLQTVEMQRLVDGPVARIEHRPPMDLPLTPVRRAHTIGLVRDEFRNFAGIRHS